MISRRLVDRIACFCVLALILSWSVPASAQKKAATKKTTRSAGGPANYSSKNFLLHTDLPADEAKELLRKLERMLSLISRYWARSNGKVIEMYVVDDVNSWPPGTLDPRGLQSIRSGGGITRSTVLSRGNSFIAKATVFAVARRGTPLHEAVHAYCAQSFGTTGPIWYGEGMAEMGCNWNEKDPSVHCESHIVRYIRGSDPKSLNEIINSPQTTGDSWQNYAWRWALCHLLANNPNYSQRFRPLGLGLLTKKNVSFEQVYGSMAQEISFEYRFFLKHIERGYRVDLCSWDWKTRYLKPRSKRALSAKIKANLGWQPSRLFVKKGEDYQVSASGTWRTSKDGKKLNANGDETGRGRLVGILFNDFQLSEPFDVGASGTFTSPGDGNLLLRCKDEWHEMADNDGKISVRLKRAGTRPGLPKSKDLEDAAEKSFDPPLGLKR